MALADTSKAIGSAAQLLSYQLTQRTGYNVTVGRPDMPAGSGARLNLFCYESILEPTMRRRSLDAGQEPPLWLALRYLLTAFDEGGKADTIGALKVMGDGLQALQALRVLPLEGIAAEDLAALSPNPEPLKLNFMETTRDLLSSVMQGTDEKYHLSMAFELRPIMIASLESAAYSLLVGIDYTSASAERKDLGIGMDVTASRGPIVSRVLPRKAQLDGELLVFGEGIRLPQSVGAPPEDDMVAELGGVELSIQAGPDASEGFTVETPASALTGDLISAGNQGLQIIETLASGRKRRSNLYTVPLLPVLDMVSVSSLAWDSPGDPDSVITVDLELDGKLLGSDEDETLSHCGGMGPPSPASISSAMWRPHRRRPRNA